MLALATTTESDGNIAGAASTTTSSFDNLAGTGYGILPSSTIDITQPSSSSSLTSTSSGGSVLSTSSIIGIALGAVSAISAVVGVWWKWKDRKKQQSMARAAKRIFLASWTYLWTTACVHAYALNAERTARVRQWLAMSFCVMQTRYDLYEYPNGTYRECDLQTRLQDAMEVLLRDLQATARNSCRRLLIASDMRLHSSDPMN